MRKIFNLAHYFPYDVKLRLLAHSRSFLANQKARNAIVGAEHLLNSDTQKSKSFVCRLLSTLPRVIKLRNQLLYKNQ